MIRPDVYRVRPESLKSRSKCATTYFALNYMRSVRGWEVKFQEGVFANIHLELDSVLFEFMQIKNNEKIYIFLTILESRVEACVP